VIILGIESSCDETAAAVIEKSGDQIKILSNIVASSQEVHVKYGGIVPENAAREQLKSIIPVITEALAKAQVTPDQVDAIAVTQGPGLIGSLLVGVETAKTLSLIWQKPLIPVNHLLAHFYAHWVNHQPKFPLIGLLVSGGHTDIILMTGHGTYQYLGGTLDDAAGECFDKCARLLDLPYPGGPNLSKLAETGDPTKFKLPKPMWDSKDLNMSFSGLKTAVINLIKAHNLTVQDHADLAAAIEQTIVDVLVKKVTLAAKRHNIEHILIAGGVAANRKLSDSLSRSALIPPPQLCTDNAVTTAVAACFISQPINPLQLEADPNLHLQNLI